MTTLHPTHEPTRGRTIAPPPSHTFERADRATPRIAYAIITWQISPAALLNSLGASALLAKASLPADTRLAAASLIITRAQHHLHATLHLEPRDDHAAAPRTVTLIDRTAPDWRWSTPLSGTHLLHADVPSALRLTLLVDRPLASASAPQIPAELLLASTPLLTSEPLSLPGGVYSVPTLTLAAHHDA